MPRTPSPSALVITRDRSTARQSETCLASAGFEVLAVVPSVAGGLLSHADAAPDLIVMDSDSCDDHGCRELSDRPGRRRTPVIYLGTAVDRETIASAHDNGAAAYVQKPFSDRQLVSAALLAVIASEREGSRSPTPRGLTPEEKLRAIAALVDERPAEADPTLRQRSHRVPSRGPSDILSARERDVVDLLSNGARVVTIARQLELSPHTVRNHLKSVFRKLNLHGQDELFEYWRDQRSAQKSP